MSFRFISDESGAATIDWVIVTSGLVGIGLAMTSVLTGALEQHSGNIAEEFGRRPFVHSFGPLTTLVEFDFANGVGNWTGAFAANLPGFGDVLMLAPGSTAMTQIAVPPGSARATISFDLIGGDDLGGDPAVIYVNGQQVSIYRDNHGTITHIDTSMPGITVQVSQIYSNEPMGGGTHGHDSRASYSIIVDSPGNNINFAIGSGANGAIEQEFYAIDDFRVTTQ